MLADMFSSVGCFNIKSRLFVSAGVLCSNDARIIIYRSLGWTKVIFPEVVAVVDEERTIKQNILNRASMKQRPSRTAGLLVENLTLVPRNALVRIGRKA